MSPVYILLLIIFGVNAKSTQEEEIELKKWISTLDPSTLQYYQKYRPYMLHTSAENVRLGDEEIKNSIAATPYGIYFSGTFTNNTVLQREPHYSSIYGGSCKPNAQITVTMINNDNLLDSAQFDITTMDNGDWKLMLPQTHPNGGDFTLNVSCPQCFNKTTKQTITYDTIYNVTFGDVYLCSGQSNMQLEMFHTFSRNLTYDNITKLGKYKNIRFFMKPSLATSSPIYTYPRSDKNNGQYWWHQSYDTDILNDMAAACWYFAQVLYDNYSMTDINIGMMSNAVGGSVIEAWTLNHTIEHYCSGTECPGPGCGGLYNGQLAPFFNMTIKAGLWYQGENDVGHYPAGSSLNHTGYGCMEPLMLQQWRSNFSVVKDTTDSSFYFGIVTLAAQTSEGHQSAMGDFRWAQSANYDILPNPVMPNTFIAQGYDIGDPWGNSCGGYCNLTDVPYSTQYTRFLDGPIHPRPKIYVGQRLARGAAKFIYGKDIIWAGPLIESCTLTNGMITINFNQSMLHDEAVYIQPFKLWYNESLTANHATSFQVLINSTWEWLGNGLMKQGSNSNSITVDVTGFTKNGMEVTGLRYGWADFIGKSPCCGDLNINHNPCPMNLCPIVTSKTLLPASPFWTQIINGKCKCFEPQQCG